VLNLQKQRVLLPQPLRQLLAIFEIVGRDIDEGGEAVCRPAGVVLNDVGIGIDKARRLIRARHPVGADEVAGLRDGGAERAGLAIGLRGRVENTPGLVGEIGRRSAGQPFEFRVRIDDALLAAHVGHRDRNRNLVEEATELLTFQRAREIGCGQKRFDLFGFVVGVVHTRSRSVMSEIYRMEG
jgi:hypothetical protein